MRKAANPVHASSGAYRPMHSAIWSDDEFIDLPPHAKLLHRFLKDTLPAIGIGPVATVTAAAAIGVSRAELLDAYAALEQPKASGMPWVLREHGVVWLVNGLRFEQLSSANRHSHVAYVRKLADALDDGLAITQRFRAHYREWFSDTLPRTVPDTLSDTVPSTEGGRESVHKRQETETETGNRDDSTPSEPDDDASSGEVVAAIVDLPSDDAPASVAPPSKRVTADRATPWMADVRRIWQERYGGAPPARAPKVLRPVVAAHGVDSTMQRLRNYMGQTEAAFVSLERFAATFGAWAGDDAAPNVESRARVLWDAFKSTRILGAQTHEQFNAAATQIVEAGIVASLDEFRDIWRTVDRTRLLNAQTDQWAAQQLATAMSASGHLFEGFPRPACDRLYETYVRAFGAVDYGRFRKAFVPLFPASGAIYPLEIVNDAIVTAHAVLQHEDPYLVRNPSPEKVAAAMGEWTRLAAMPQINEYGIATERGNREGGLRLGAA